MAGAGALTGTAALASAGFAAGAVNTTHLFNAMVGAIHRDPGLALTALLDDAVWVELIADTLHVDPDLWPLIWKLKPAERKKKFLQRLRDLAAHEFGHAFGLPDLYGVGGAHSGIGNWGLMGTGSWGCNGASPQLPCHMSAWSKSILGWVDVETLPPGTDLETVVAAVINRARKRSAQASTTASRRG